MDSGFHLAAIQDAQHGLTHPGNLRVPAGLDAVTVSAELGKPVLRASAQQEPGATRDGLTNFTWTGIDGRSPSCHVHRLVGKPFQQEDSPLCNPAVPPVAPLGASDNVLYQIEASAFAPVVHTEALSLGTAPVSRFAIGHKRADSQQSLEGFLLAAAMATLQGILSAQESPKHLALQTHGANVVQGVVIDGAPAQPQRSLICQAGLWGLIRSFGSEHTAIQCHGIDLSQSSGLPTLTSSKGPAVHSLLGSSYGCSQTAGRILRWFCTLHFSFSSCVGLCTCEQCSTLLKPDCGPCRCPPGRQAAVQSRASRLWHTFLLAPVPSWRAGKPGPAAFLSKVPGGG